MDLINTSSMGIDYGSVRVGIALSQAGSTLAFPHDVYENNRELFDRICAEIEIHDVSDVVMGESFDFAGRENIVMKDIKDLKTRLEKKYPEKNFCYEPEFYTSAQAERLQGSSPSLDASAATLILQSWLDRQRVALGQRIEDSDEYEPEYDDH